MVKRRKDNKKMVPNWVMQALNEFGFIINYVDKELGASFRHHEHDSFYVNYLVREDYLIGFTFDYYDELDHQLFSDIGANYANISYVFIEKSESKVIPQLIDMTLSDFKNF